MFSSRYYTPRKYYRRRYNGNFKSRKYNPSMSMYQSPLPYQQIGRTLQARPTTVNQPLINGLITPQKMDAMYKILEDNHYAAIQPKPVSSYSGFHSKEYSLNDLIPYNSIGTVAINKEFIENILTSEVTFPTAPAGYVYNWQLTNIVFIRSGISDFTDDSRYTLQWTGPFLVSGTPPVATTRNLIHKTVDTTMSLDYNSTIMCTPGPSNNQCVTKYIAYSTGSISSANGTNNTIDSNINDNGYYPLMTSDGTIPTFNQYIVFNQESGTVASYDTKLIFNIYYYLTKL